jgi:hypothetical protein
MPIICEFLNLVVKVYYSDHPPPHFHVLCGEYRASFEIRTGRLISGKIPPASKKKVLEWLFKERPEIFKAWRDAQFGRVPRRVRPLE